MAATSTDTSSFGTGGRNQPFNHYELNKTDWDVPAKYTDLIPIGCGAYGSVCSALNQELKMRMAVKKLARPFQSVTHAKRTYRELRLLKHMHHENVIGLLDVFSPASSLLDFNDMYLVTHLMGADLNQIIKSQKLTDDHVQFLIYQVLRGLKYIHSAGIIHRYRSSFLSLLNIKKITFCVFTSQLKADGVLLFFLRLYVCLCIRPPS